MLAGIRNGVVHLPGDTIYYIRFGSGCKTLIILPGLGDGLTTVKGTALPMALLHRAYARGYTVYMFSRRNHLSKGCTTRSIAHDLRQALDALHIETIALLNRLEEIAASTLVIGGDASRKLATLLPRAQLKMYPQWRHGLYEEAKDFHSVVLDFLRGG